MKRKGANVQELLHHTYCAVLCCVVPYGNEHDEGLARGGTSLE